MRKFKFGMGMRKFEFGMGERTAERSMHDHNRCMYSVHSHTYGGCPVHSHTRGGCVQYTHTHVVGFDTVGQHYTSYSGLMVLWGFNVPWYILPYTL